VIASPGGACPGGQPKCSVSSAPSAVSISRGQRVRQQAPGPGNLLGLETVERLLELLARQQVGQAVRHLRGLCVKHVPEESLSIDCVFWRARQLTQLAILDDRS
jgi:hypothetical protein